ncbi:hypothetical protein TNIN_5421 [Trichonephila inaurata madagascariensis]|uniref:Uncharacterized protein n=1 Tax=Trichonephila inaurata madagascariensis TaxID=2747483 RepID=A0A8X6YUR2_9ARAC|nr:hypothetical protein TNIN_5421 [Trichonephila inaurata madagascariensis]
MCCSNSLAPIQARCHWISPTSKDGFTVTPSVWLALVREFAAISIKPLSICYEGLSPTFPNCYRKCDLHHMATLFPAKGLLSQIFDSSFHAKRNGMECIKRYPKSSRRKTGNLMFGVFF